MIDVDKYMEAHTKNGYHDEGANGFSCIECKLWRIVLEYRTLLMSQQEAWNDGYDEAVRGLRDEVRSRLVRE